MNRYLFFMVFGFISCSDISKKELPENLDEAVNYFERCWTKQEKTDFIEDSLNNAHFSTGRWIRNNWIYGQRDTALVKYFNCLGIYHHDDISSIILTSLYRKLTNQPIDLDTQIKVSKAYWPPILECDAHEKKKAWDNFQIIEIGDKITIFMEVDTTNDNESVIIRDCPNPDWTFDLHKDLKFNGLVTGKYYINDTMNVFIKVKVLKMNKDSVSGIVNVNKTGIIQNLSMKFLKYEIES